MSYSKNKVTSIQTLIQNFFLERLIQQRGVTSRTIESYRDTFKIYIKYLQEMFNISVENIDISDFSQDKVLLFLKYLEEIGPFLPEFSVYNASIVFHSYQPTFLIYNLLTLSIPQIIDYFSLTYGIIVLE